MVVHSFNIEIAQSYGVPAAILYNHFQYWIAKNLTNQKNFHDGRTWTYNTIRAFADQFPYLSVWDIRQALKKLIDGGVLMSGNYNKRKNDRTLWYCFTDEKAALKGLPSHLWDSHNNSESHTADCESHTADCKSHTASCESHAALPNPKPDYIPKYKPNGKPNPTELKKSFKEVLALDSEISEKSRFFMSEINRLLKPNKREAVTFASITKFMIKRCQDGELPVSVFTDCIEYAKQAVALRTARNPRAIFVAKVKETTGFTKQEKLLSK